MKSAYIAGRLWNDNDRVILDKIDAICKKLGIKTFLPHRDVGLFKTGMNSKHFFEKDRDMIDECDFMIAVLDWKCIGSGTAWEIGYAHAKDRHVIGFVEDLESVNRDDRVCVMCLNSVKLVGDLKDLEKEIKKILTL